MDKKRESVQDGDRESGHPESIAGFVPAKPLPSASGRPNLTPERFGALTRRDHGPCTPPDNAWDAI